MKGRLKQIRKHSMAQYGFGTEAMRKIKICGKCGKPSDISQHVCNECGTKLPEETLYDTYKTRHRACPRCDTVVPHESDYCPRCGRKL